MNHLESRIARLRRKYGEKMWFGQIATEEDCSTRTVSRMAHRGEFGQVNQRNQRVIWVYTESYIEYLRTKTVILKASA